MSANRNALTPEALGMMDAIARAGSFAAAARELGKVPSSLTYSVRQLEDALDVLLFDRSSRHAILTAAGEELLGEGRRLLEQMDAVANRVKRVATGWETQLSIAADGVISNMTLFELCESFFAHEPRPGTRLRWRTETLAGTWEALMTGQADLAIGVGTDRALPPGVQMKELGKVGFVFAVAPHHPLAAAVEPISDGELLRHRAVAVADSAQRLAPLTVHLLPGQDVFTVSSMQTKIEAQLRCLGCGYVPEALARDHIEAGRLVVKPVERGVSDATIGYAWRTPVAVSPTAASKFVAKPKPPLGLALGWWLARLESPTTRRALLERHGNEMRYGAV